ncbi:unnamed protein product [Paramecium pentaurelia]|uniref:J domain-containing protein n=1 Tax=Paramecium pentaurelia TaxID=43138 RepID=A0A8S1XB84_9CILI|nr:unnamed protein product [Paramecium pentaurelia]CAD8198496.1 unnamed protein product [Paramecium pentaurelia]
MAIKTFRMFETILILFQLAANKHLHNQYMNYYNILGISNNSSHAQIKQAYRDLAKQHHPDKNPQSTQFRMILEAYRILSNPDLRCRYDQIQAQMERQISLFYMIRNFINGNQEKTELNNDTNTKDTEIIENESKNREVTQIHKKKIKKNHH